MLNLEKLLAKLANKQIPEIYPINPNTGYPNANGTTRIERVGCQCNLIFCGVKNATNGWMNIGYVPERFRPKYADCESLTVGQANGRGTNLLLSLSSSTGLLRVHNYTTETGTVTTLATMSYICNGD